MPLALQKGMKRGLVAQDSSLSSTRNLDNELLLVLQLTAVKSSFREGPEAQIKDWTGSELQQRMKLKQKTSNKIVLQFNSSTPVPSK